MNMHEITNPNKPLLKGNPTFRPEVAVEMQAWCKANAKGKWEINSADSAMFELPDDAARFTKYFWTPTVSFDV